MPGALVVDLVAFTGHGSGAVVVEFDTVPPHRLEFDCEEGRPVEGVVGWAVVGGEPCAIFPRGYGG